MGKKMEKRDTSNFIKDLSEIGISLTEKQLEQFLRYYELLVEWNEKINLTAITEYQEVLKKHFVDSRNPHRRLLHLRRS